MKKKILVYSLILAMAAIAIVGGSLAWFGDEDAVTNVFTVGSIDIVQNEVFEQGSQLIPVVNVGLDPSADVTADANFVQKEVNVSNVGANDAYVQTFVAVPAQLDEAGVLHIHVTSDDWIMTRLEDTVTGLDSAQPLLTYSIYKFVYKGNGDGILVSQATTSNVMDGVYVDWKADRTATYNGDGTVNAAYFVMDGTVLTEYNAAELLNVYVASQAIQARGFSDAAEALSNFAAHPWAD